MHRDKGWGGWCFVENMACRPTVFRYEWPDDIKADIVTLKNRRGGVTNSDLEMAGLLMTWLVMEEVCGNLSDELQSSVTTIQQYHG